MDDNGMCFVYDPYLACGTSPSCSETKDSEMKILNESCVGGVGAEDRKRLNIARKHGVRVLMLRVLGVYEKREKWPKCQYWDIYTHRTSKPI